MKLKKYFLLILPSLFPLLYLALFHRPTTERTPTQLPVTKKCCLLRLLQNQVDLIPEKVVFIPKTVDSFPEIVYLSVPKKNAPKCDFSCTSANFVVPLHREPALGMSALGLYSRVCELAATMLHHSTQHYTALNNATGEG